MNHSFLTGWLSSMKARATLTAADPKNEIVLKMRNFHWLERNFILSEMKPENVHLFSFLEEIGHFGPFAIEKMRYFIFILFV